MIDPLDREVVVAVWSRRAVAESRAASAFERVRDALRPLGATPELIALAERASEDERRHSVLCHHVASVYRGADVLLPAPDPLPTAAGSESSPAVRTLLIVSQCCISETIACSFLETCLFSAEAPLVRAVLRELLTDDIDHARIGWAYLAAALQGGLSPRWIAERLTALLSANLSAWRGRIEPLPARGVPLHGCPAATVIEQCVLQSLREIVIPGFGHLGIDTVRAMAWLATEEANG